jgi:sugar/nucleoside kinase (ribokinase family)
MELTVLGHLTQDILRKGTQEVKATGGSACYCSLAGSKLGKSVGLVSKSNFNPFTENESISTSGLKLGDNITTFVNTYINSHRKQEVLGVAEPILETDIPKEFLQSKSIHLGPIINEIPFKTIKFIRENSKALISIDVQGLIRKLDGKELVKVKFNPKKLIGLVDVVKISLQDEFRYLFRDLEECKNFFKETNMIGLVTDGENGSTILNKEVKTVPAFRTNTIDPTGAGDVYTAAFDIRYSETKNLYKSALFASAAASFVVEDWGPKNIPTEKMVKARLKR